MTVDNLVTTIPILSTEWSLSLDIRFFGTIPTGSNIIKFTIKDVRGTYGKNIPTLYVKAGTSKLMVASSINGNYNADVVSQNIPIGKLTHVEVHQRYVSGGLYRFFVIIDGNEVASVINNDARQFHNVKGYANVHGEESPKAYISNFKHTNFL